MSRSGYIDDHESTWSLIMYRGAVKRALRGKRGQSFLREMLAALDAMLNKRLVTGEIVSSLGEACAIGSVAISRGMDTASIDPKDYGQVATAFGIAESMAREIEYENDEFSKQETPEQRWERMRAWAVENIQERGL